MRSSQAVWQCSLFAVFPLLRHLRSLMSSSTSRSSMRTSNQAPNRASLYLYSSSNAFHVGDTQTGACSSIIGPLFWTLRFFAVATNRAFSHEARRVTVVDSSLVRIFQRSQGLLETKASTSPKKGKALSKPCLDWSMLNQSNTHLQVVRIYQTHLHVVEFKPTLPNPNRTQNASAFQQAAARTLSVQRCTIPGCDHQQRSLKSTSCHAGPLEWPRRETNIACQTGQSITHTPVLVTHLSNAFSDCRT